MEIKPHPFQRGATLDSFDGRFIGGIGAFSKACVGEHQLEEALEVVLFEGSKAEGYRARLGDRHHHLYEGPLKTAEVSFALETFATSRQEAPLKWLPNDSRTLQFKVKKNLRDFILNEAHRLGVHGGLLYIKGVSTDLHIYGHSDTHKLNDQTKTFDHVPEPAQIEGWGNLSFVDGDLNKPFVHMHGTYMAWGNKKGGHYIMDGQKNLVLESADLILYPLPLLMRAKQQEDFPTWKI